MEGSYIAVTTVLGNCKAAMLLIVVIHGSRGLEHYVHHVYILGVNVFGLWKHNFG